MINCTEIEAELNKFCPEFHPCVRYSPEGIEVRCDWALSFIADPLYTVEDSKCKMMDHLYEHLGKLTVLLHRLEKED